MKILEAIGGRRSIRKFLGKEIAKDTLEKILSAGAQAPSAKNRQPWKFIVIPKNRVSEMLGVMRSGLEHEKSGLGLLPNYTQFIDSAERTFCILEEAAVTVFVLNTENNFSLHQSTEEKLFEMGNVQSIGAAIQNILLAALEYGVGSLWICDIYFAYQDLLAWLNTDRQIIAAVALGYPAENPFPRPRKPLDAVIEWK